MKRGTKKALPEFTLSQIIHRFDLAAAGGSPPIGRRSHGGWYIRCRVGLSVSGATTQERFDYFYIADDGEILSAPRGFAKDYRPGRIVDVGGPAWVMVAAGVR